MSISVEVELGCVIAPPDTLANLISFHHQSPFWQCVQACTIHHQPGIRDASLSHSDVLDIDSAVGHDTADLESSVGNEIRLVARFRVVLAGDIPLDSSVALDRSRHTPAPGTDIAGTQRPDRSLLDFARLQPRKGWTALDYLVMLASDLSATCTTVALCLKARESQSRAFTFSGKLARSFAPQSQVCNSQKVEEVTRSKSIKKMDPKSTYQFLSRRQFLALARANRHLYALLNRCLHRSVPHS